MRDNKEYREGFRGRHEEDSAGGTEAGREA